MATIPLLVPLWFLVCPLELLLSQFVSNSQTLLPCQMPTMYMLLVPMDHIPKLPTQVVYMNLNHPPH